MMLLIYYNVRRIQRYSAAKIKAAQAVLNEKTQTMTPQDSFFAALGHFWAGCLRPRLAHTLVVGF